MIIRPQTRVRLFTNIPVDPSYQNVLQFDTLQEQTNYFMGQLAYREYTNFNYIDATQELRIPENMENMYNVSYIAYQNATFGSKWFYAFVNRLEYYSPNTTALFFTVDNYQSWCFDVQLHNSFIERETTGTDNVGEYLLEEGLETGEYVCTSEEYSHDFLVDSDGKYNATFVIIGVSYGSGQTEINVQANGTTPDGEFSLAYIIPNTVKAYNGGKFVNGIFCGTNFIAFTCDFTNSETIAASTTAINQYITEKTASGQIEAITAAFMVKGYVIMPLIMGGTNPSGPDGWGYSINRPTTLNGYSPKNNKLFTREFLYLLTTNNSGSVREFAWEYGNDKYNLRFTTRSALGNSPEMMLVPLDYNGIQEDYSNTMTINSFPLISYSYNSYQNELGLNRVANSVGAVNGVVDLGQSMLTNSIKGGLSIASSLIGIDLTKPTAGIGNALSTAGGVAVDNINTGIDYAQGVADAVGKHVDHARAPNTTFGSCSPSIAFSLGKLDFNFRVMCVRPEFAKRADDYFSMYGYKINQVKAINVHKRTNWDYIKCKNAVITGTCPQSIVKFFQDLFVRGVTFWHKRVFDYADLSNPILGG